VRYFSDGKIDTMGKTDEELVSMCNSLGIMDVKIADGTATLLDKLWKKARVNTVHPFFLVLPPVELEPLAKRDPQNPKLTQRFQVVAGGAELGKAFSELNDPIDQFGRFEHQQKARDEGNDEAQFMDKAYVEAMEYGMPPMAGFGTSERFVSFLLGKHIKECVTFPHVRNKMVNDTKNEEIVT
jgi:lysyl-tRNA synthetase, class II